MVGDLVRYCSFSELRSALLEDISQFDREDFEREYGSGSVEEATYNFLIDYWYALVYDDIDYILMVKDGKLIELTNEKSFADFMYEYALDIVRGYIYGE